MSRASTERDVNMNVEENRKREEQRRVQETDKGQNVDIMV